jgi:hypothetical protein
MLLYPIDQKDLYLDPWFDIFQGFKEDLSGTRNWLVVGYSFNDLFIREIFLECLERGNHRLIVVCPEASNIVEKKFGLNRTNIRPIDGKIEEEETISHIREEIIEAKE